MGSAFFGLGFSLSVSSFLFSSSWSSLSFELTTIPFFSFLVASFLRTFASSYSHSHKDTHSLQIHYFALTHTHAKWRTNTQRHTLSLSYTRTHTHTPINIYTQMHKRKYTHSTVLFHSNLSGTVLCLLLVIFFLSPFYTNCPQSFIWFISLFHSVSLSVTVSPVDWLVGLFLINCSTHTRVSKNCYCVAV